MKSLFIEAKRKFKSPVIDSRMLPRKIGLVSTVQFLPAVKEVEKKLYDNNITVLKSKTLFNEAQILGCNISAAEKIKGKVSAFLLLSTGKWHALMLSALGKPVFIYDGERIEKLDEEEIKRFNSRKKAALIRFLSEQKIGILVSTKHGQFKLKEAIALKSRLEKKGKQAFIFIADNLNPSEFENFGVNVFINTACPGLFFDSNRILNLQDLPRI